MAVSGTIRVWPGTGSRGPVGVVLVTTWRVVVAVVVPSFTVRVTVRVPAVA